jgi:hypothetical protein
MGYNPGLSGSPSYPFRGPSMGAIVKLIVKRMGGFCLPYGIRIPISGRRQNSFNHGCLPLLLLFAAALGSSSTGTAADSTFSWPGWKIPAHALKERGALAIVADVDALSIRRVPDKDGKENAVSSALQQRVGRRAIAKNTLIVARTPLLVWAAIEPGVYRVSARIKFDGDTGVIGTPIQLSVNLHSRIAIAVASRNFSATDLVAPGEYQTISFLYEVSPDGDKRLAPREARSPWTAYKWLDEVYPDCEPVKAAAAEKRTPAQGLVITLSLPKTKMLSKEGMPPNSLRWVRLDSIALEKVEPARSITVRAVRPEKIWLRPGQQNSFTVHLENFSTADHKRTLAVILERGLAARTTIHTVDVELPAGQAKTVSIPWKTTKDTAWFGYKVIAEIRQGDQIESAAHDYFQVHPRNYDVHIAGSRTRAVDPFRHREKYTNVTEVFAATPGDMTRILPKGDAWTSGMSGGNVVYTYKMVRAATNHNRKHGIQTIMYLYGGGTGAPTMDMHMAHPEWIRHKVVSTDPLYAAMSARDDEVAQWDWEKKGLIPNQEKGNPRIEQLVNHRFPALQKQIESQLLAFIDKTGYGGVRFDVTMLSTAPGNLTILGTESTVEIKDPMAHAAKNFNSLRAAIEAKYPHFEWGANMDSYQYLDTITERTAPVKPAKSYPEFIDFCRAHGMVEDEGTMSAPFYDHYMNRWEDAWYFMNLKRAICRKHGGGIYQLFSPHRDGTGHFNHDDIYFTAMTIASGSHYVGSYAPPPYSEDSMGAFAMRFSEFFWNEKLRPADDAENLIFVDSPAELWYAEGVTQMDIGAKRRYVVPLLNPPLA